MFGDRPFQFCIQFLLFEKLTVSQLNVLQGFLRDPCYTGSFLSSQRRMRDREAIRFPVSQKIARILWNPKVHYRFHKSPPPVGYLSWFRSIQFMLHLRLDLPSDLPSGFSHQNPICTSSAYVLYALPISVFLI